MIEYFRDWTKRTGSFYQKTVTTDPVGRDVITWPLVSGGDNITVNFWTDNSLETLTSDKFVNQKTGRLLLDPAEITFTPDTTMKFTSEGIDYFIVGNDDVADFDEVLVLKWARDYINGI